MKYYFVGIKGTGMSALAKLLKDQGNEVVGSDVVEHYFTEDSLIEKGITIKNFDENNIDSDMTIIKTKFKKGKEEGTIAIIGPKRMEYDRVVGMLEYMKENIER